jgi:hypothetical protein
VTLVFIAQVQLACPLDTEANLSAIISLWVQHVHPVSWVHAAPEEHARVEDKPVKRHVQAFLVCSILEQHAGHAIMESIAQEQLALNWVIGHRHSQITLFKVQLATLAF